LRRWQFGAKKRAADPPNLVRRHRSASVRRASSYTDQMLRGVDYWRTVLDGASGIDIYGHNGVSVGDIDGDGFDDLYVCQPAGLPNRLYRNRGDGTFEDITEASGVGLLENTACAIFADFDNDGRQDLIVVRAAGPLLVPESGRRQISPQAQCVSVRQSSAGNLHRRGRRRLRSRRLAGYLFLPLRLLSGRRSIQIPHALLRGGKRPAQFHAAQQSRRNLSRRDRAIGLNQNNTRYSFCCGWGDYNRDGWPDLYVVNDFGRKNLYRNNGDGTFTDIAPQAGVEDVGAGMSVCWFDYDNDGLEDLYVADMWTAAGERISTQEIFQRDAPRARALYIANTPWAIRYCEIAATEHFRTPPRRAAPGWADGPGRAMPGISIMTVFPISTSRTEWSPARSEKT
jgi:hypothetical protein